MFFEQDLPPEEIAVLDELILLFSQRMKRWLSLKDLIEAWENFVEQVEVGYSDSIYEYTNDLSARDLLQEVLDHAGPITRGRLVHEMQSLDERFLTATVPIDKPILPRTSDRGIQDWWFRVPRKLTNELESDLKSEGLL